MTGESRKMTAVYFIPDLRSTIISLGQATEAGCNVRLRGDYLTMHDRDGRFLVKANRSRNCLYKLRMGLKEAARLKITSISESTRWHARLGHVNLRTMKAMIQRELVTGIPSVQITKEICSSCLLGKQTRQVFPKATTYRASINLELVHGDVCGPITPSTFSGKRYVL